MLRIQLSLAALGCLFGLCYPLAVLACFLVALGVWGVAYSLTLFSNHAAVSGVVVIVGVYYMLPFFGAAAIGSLVRMAFSQ